MRLTEVKDPRERFGNPRTKSRRRDIKRTLRICLRRDGLTVVVPIVGNNPTTTKDKRKELEEGFQDILRKKS